MVFDWALVAAAPGLSFRRLLSTLKAPCGARVPWAEMEPRFSEVFLPPTWLYATTSLESAASGEPKSVAAEPVEYRHCSAERHCAEQTENVFFAQAAVADD